VKSEKQTQFKPKTNPILSAVGGLQMNVNSLITMNYKNFIPLAGYKNKPNSNPIQTQTNPILSAVGGFEMNVNAFLQKDYENEPPSGQKKQSQNKPKTNPVLSAVEWANFKPGIGCRDNFLDLGVLI